MTARTPTRKEVPMHSKPSSRRFALQTAALLLALTLSACGQGGGAASPVSGSSTGSSASEGGTSASQPSSQETVSSETSSEPVSSAPSPDSSAEAGASEASGASSSGASAETAVSLSAVLRQEQPLTAASGGSDMLLGPWLEALYGLPLSEEHTALAAVDLDGDGTPEAVLCQSAGEDVLGLAVLHLRDGAVYGYAVPWRGMLELKADGSFSYSNGAWDSGLARLTFEGDAAVTQPFAACTGEPDETAAYTVDGQPADEETFSDALTRQSEKPDASWTAYTPDAAALFPAE